MRVMAFLAERMMLMSERGGAVEGEQLTVVIIGKNEEPHLAGALESTRRIPIPHRVLYVDSASSDHSVSIARSGGVRVAELAASHNLCPSAGRYVGTLLADTEWLLYMDGDMELAEEFGRLIPELMDRAPTDSRTVGFVGLYVNADETGLSRSNVLRQNERHFAARTFGGSLLIRREAVENSGQWNPRVSSYEELDLHTRLLAMGKRIEFIPATMVVHHTETTPSAVLLKRLFWPFGDRRMAGIGELVRSRYQNHCLLEFLRFYPYPLTYLTLLVLGCVLSCLSMPAVGAGVLAAAAVYGAATGGVRSLIVYPSFPLRVILGFFTYPSGWCPEYSLLGEVAFDEHGG